MSQHDDGFVRDSQIAAWAGLRTIVGRRFRWILLDSPTRIPSNAVEPGPRRSGAFGIVAAFVVFLMGLAAISLAVWWGMNQALVAEVTPVYTQAATPALPPSLTPLPTWTPTPSPTRSTMATALPADAPIPTPSALPTDVSMENLALTDGASLVSTPFVLTIVTILPTMTPVMPGADTDVRWIDVDLTDQVLTAYEGQTVVRTTPVSTGLPKTPTPVGMFRIWIKLRYDDMRGPGYYLRDVPYTMYFLRGYGLHGTYWHSNFGHPMSHGCVNLPTSEARWLFGWADVGTLVNIHY